MDYSQSDASEKPLVGTGGTQAIARAAALLRELATANDGQLSLAELARSLGLERPTAYRILRRLVDEGLARQDTATKGYTLGPLVYELGLVAQPPLSMQALAGEALGHLAEQSGDTAFAIVRSNLDSVCLDRREGSYPVKALLMGVGRRRPLGVGAGSLALLSALPAATATHILDANAARLRQAGESDVAVLQQCVNQARADGHALRVPTDAPEILSLGVAVCNRYGTPIMALSISAIAYRIQQRMASLLGTLNDARRLVEDRLRESAPGGAASADPQA